MTSGPGEISFETEIISELRQFCKAEWRISYWKIFSEFEQLPGDAYADWLCS